MLLIGKQSELSGRYHRKRKTKKTKNKRRLLQGRIVTTIATVSATSLDTNQDLNGLRRHCIVYGRDCLPKSWYPRQQANSRAVINKECNPTTVMHTNYKRSVWRKLHMRKFPLATDTPNEKTTHFSTTIFQIQ